MTAGSLSVEERSKASVLSVAMGKKPRISRWRAPEPVDALVKPDDRVQDSGFAKLYSHGLKAY